LETAKINVLQAKNSGKAELNLTGTAGLYGLADNGGSSYSNAADGQGTEWSLGLNFKMPLSRDGSDAALDEAMAQMRKVELELSKARGIISLEVDTAFGRVDAAKQRIATSKNAVELATQRLKQEEDLLDEGQGDFYRVVEQQQILNDTQVNLVISEAGHSKSVVSIWLASGQIFSRLGILAKDVEVALALATDSQR